MSLASLVNKFLFGKSSDEPADDFIRFDRSGPPRFDVAAYLASEEGRESLARISEANRKSARESNEAA